MIAEVYPIKRLPRSMGAFDYRVPDGVQVERGHLVQIQLRGKPVWGVVKRLKKKPERGITLKDIRSVNADMSLREEELSFFEWLAFDLVQSVSSILHTALPTPPKRTASKQNPTPKTSGSITLPRNEIHSLTRTVKSLKSHRECIVQTPDLKRMAVALAAYRTSEPEKKIVVIVPTVKQAKTLSAYLSDLDPIVVTGEESNNERYRRYNAMRNNPSTLCVGTKVLALLVDQTVTTFFIFDSSDKNHKQADRNPRFDVRAVVWKLHNHFQTNVFFFDPAPRVVDQFLFPPSGRIVWDSANETQVLDMRVERQGSSSFFLSHTAENSIRECLDAGKRVLCVLNRKGVSAGLRCQNCSSSVSCPSCGSLLRVMKDSLKCGECSTIHPMIFRCTTCGNTKLQNVSIGIDGFAQSLSELFPGIVTQTLSKDSKQAEKDHHILITTSFFFEHSYDPFSTLPYDLVLLIDADTPLFVQTTSAKEHALRQVLQWKGVADLGKASFITQTSYPNLFSELMADPLPHFESELELRRRYNKPPFSRLIQITNKEPESRRAELELHQLKKRLQSEIECRVSRQKSTPDGIKMNVSIAANDFSHIQKIFTELPDHYIIDTQCNL